MAKKGVLRITGNTSPKTGVKTFYKVTEWYPDTPLSERKESLVTWELFRKRENGKFTTTNIKKNVGEFTFGKDAWQYTFRVEGYLDRSEGKEPMSIIVKPQKNEQQALPKEKEILGVKLTYQDGTQVNKKLSYKDRLWATAKCQGMEGEPIIFTLWEDDEKDNGHNKKNQSIVKSPPVLVDSKGYARWNFALLNTYIAIANKREDDKKQHEYYVTAEYNGKLKASDNANANNPEYKAPQPAGNNGGKPQPKPALPKPKPDSPKGSTRPNSLNNQPDKKGKITKVKLTDKNGKEFTKNPKFGETIIVHIESKNLKNKKYTLKIWEHDTIGNNDLLYSHEHTFLGDKINLSMPLTAGMQKTGEIGNDPKNPDSGEYWKGGQQEIFAEVIYIDISAKSKIIDVDIMEAPKPQNNGNTATGVKNQPKPETLKDGKCRSCQILLSVNDLDKFMTAAGHGSILNKAPYNTRIPAYIINLNKYMTDFEINNNCYRRANFLGQVAKETKFWSYKEDFIYPPSRLTSKFSNFKTEIGKKHAKEWGYGDNKSEITKEREIKIANWAYSRGDKAKDLGNNICPENDLQNPEQDGYKFRGRGLIQLTGRKNYQGFQDWYDKNYTKVGLVKQDFMKNPDLLFNSEYIVLSAIYFWMKNNLNSIADKGVAKENVRKISNVINSGEDDDTKAIRYDYVKSAHAMLSEKASDCQFQTKSEPQKKSNEWHDPIDNPQITLHNFNGGYDPDFSSFGGHRGRAHTGLDIFAINKKTKIYACLKGEIVYNDVIPGYGKTIVLKVDKDLLEKHKKNYTLKYDKEVTKGDLYDSGKDRYILYGHLNSYEFKSKNVEPGDVIAISGVTGVAEGTHGPHLHIEFSCKKLPQKGDNYKYRCNPLLYISLSKEDLQLQKQYNKANRSTDKV